MRPRTRASARSEERPSPAARRRSKPTLVLSVPSETSFLALVRNLTTRMAETAGFEKGTAERLALAVDEATTNVLEHAYRGATDRRVELQFEDRGPDFRVDIVDNGATVDPKAVPQVDLKRYVRERRTGGLGVHLMAKIMDSVTFRRSARRNVCRLVKHKNGRRAGGE